MMMELFFGGVNDPFNPPLKCIEFCTVLSWTSRSSQPRPATDIHPSACLHFSPLSPLACQVHLLFLAGTLPSPHAHLPQLCSSQHFLTSCSLFLLLALQKTRLMQHNRSRLFIVDFKPPLQRSHKRRYCCFKCSVI